MYEMHVGIALPEGDFVWHVAAIGTATALCGQSLHAEPLEERDRTDRHCTPCMSSFQQLMNDRR
ncbi:MULTISPECIES: hypothetical protein [unclassified Streptomyces]|uniref:hypothetical protein n=1 Tax=unclassified Streptomyces TaxID=2593676 RepID=UPI0033B5DCF0